MTDKIRRRLPIALVALAALGAFGVFGAGSASAAPDFSQCPLENENVESCFYSETTGGEFVIGTSTVPITKKVILQGGTYVTNPETGASAFVNAKNGETLSKTALNVPGGLAGLVNCKEISIGFIRVACEVVFENGTTGVTATAELVGPVGYNFGAFSRREGTALQLPVRVKLSNPFLGSECYIGNSKSPVTLKLTSGTTAPPLPNKPISGTQGKITFSEGGELLEAKGYKLVDNSFSAPEASGCGGIFSFVVNPIVNLKEGLPAAAGKNTAILTGTAFIGGRSIVE